MQFSLDRKRRSHKQNQCSASDSVGLIFTRSYRFTLLITTPTTTPSLVKTSLKPFVCDVPVAVVVCFVGCWGPCNLRSYPPSLHLFFPFPFQKKMPDRSLLTLYQPILLMAQDHHMKACLLCVRVKQIAA